MPEQGSNTRKIAGCCGCGCLLFLAVWLGLVVVIGASITKDPEAMRRFKGGR